jgi:RNA recognition motif-containing protein
MDLSCKLFIGNLPRDVTEGELLRVFTEFGELQEIFIMGGGRSRSGQSSAFVKYATMDSCERAISAVNMRGRVRPDDPDPVVVKYAKSAATLKRERPLSNSAVVTPINELTAGNSSSIPSSPLQADATSLTMLAKGGGAGGGLTHPPMCKLFVGGLPCFVDRDDLIAIFAPFGHIDSVHLMQGKSKSGQSCAFVTFQYPGPAQRAIDVLSARYVIDEDAAAISVRFADSETHNPPTSTAPPPAKRQQLIGNKGG